MNFVHPLLEKAIEINEGEIVTLVIENPISLRNTVNGIINASPEFVLSKNFIPIELSKHTEFVTDMFGVDFATKKISTKLNAEAERLSTEYPNETFSLFGALNDYAEMISESFEYPIKFSLVENAEKLIKMLEFSVDSENMSFPEALITYMELCRGFFGKKFFVFLNLKSFLSDSELETFCKNIAYEQFCTMFLESFDCGRRSEYEKKIIIDNDLCVICDENIDKRRKL